MPQNGFTPAPEQTGTPGFSPAPEEQPLKSPILGRPVRPPPIDLGALIASPLLLEGLVTAPLKTLGALASGYLGGKGARLGTAKLGGGETAQDIAEVGGNLTAGALGGWLTPGFRNMVFPKATPPAPETIPAQSLTESPNYPDILAGRALARQQARAVLMPKWPAPKVATPSPTALAGTPTNVTSPFDAPLPQAGSIAQPRLAIPSETIPAQSLSESPNYPDILAGRALARQQARAVLMPKWPAPKVATPSPTALAGTPTNVTSPFDAPLPQAGSIAQPRLAIPSETIPAQSLSESPNYPDILAGRALARQQARAVLMPKAAPKVSPAAPGPVGTPTNAPSSFTGELPPVPSESSQTPVTTVKPATPKAAPARSTVVVPEPTGGDPRWMASIKRPGLLPAALQGREGAGQQLQNLGRTVLYEPRGGVGYPGPRLGPQSLNTEEPPITIRPSETPAAEAPAIVRPMPTRSLGPTRLTPPTEQPAIRIAPTPRSEPLKTYYGITQDMRDYVDSQALEIQKMPEALRTARMEELKNFGGKGTMLKERLAMEAAKDSGTPVSATAAPVSSQNQIRILENQERALLDQSSRSRTWTKGNELIRRAQRISEKIKVLKGTAE